MATQTDILRTIIRCDGAETVAKQLGLVGNAAAESEKKLQGLATKAGTIANVAGGIGAGMLAAAGGLLKVAGAAEQAEIAFTTLLKSPQVAKQHLKELADFAANTPFEFTGLRTLSTQLLAYGFNVKSVIPMLRTLGDAGSALGQGPEGLARMIRAIGQIQAKGRVQAQEMLQLAEAGVPVFKIMQEELGLSAAQVGEIGRAGVSSKEGIAALLRGMEKLYGGGMARQAQTLNGVLSNLKDQLALAGMEMGATLIPAAKWSAEYLKNMTERLRSLSPAAKAAIGAFLLFGGVTAILASVGARVVQLVALWKLAAAQKATASTQAVAAEHAEATAVERTAMAYGRKSMASGGSFLSRGRLPGAWGQAQMAVGLGMGMTRAAQVFTTDDPADKMSKAAAAAGYLAGAFNPLILAATGLGEVIGAIVEGYYNAKAAKTAREVADIPGVRQGQALSSAQMSQQWEKEYKKYGMPWAAYVQEAWQNQADLAKRTALADAQQSTAGASAMGKADTSGAEAATARAKAVFAYREATGQKPGVGPVQQQLLGEAAAHQKIAAALYQQAQYTTDAVKRKGLYAEATKHETDAIERMTEARKLGNDVAEKEKQAAERAVKEHDQRVKDAIEAKTKAMEAYTKAIENQSNALNRSLSISNAYAQYLEAIGNEQEANAYRRGVGAQQAATAAQFAFATGDALAGWQAATEAERLARAGSDSKSSLGFSSGTRAGALTGAVPGYALQAAGRTAATINLRLDNTVRDEAGTARARMRRDDRIRTYLSN